MEANIEKTYFHHFFAILFTNDWMWWPKGDIYGVMRVPGTLDNIRGELGTGLYGMGYPRG